MQHPADNYGMFAAAQPLPHATRRVLVIDDDPAVLKVLGLVLQRRGFSVDTMGSAKDALALVPQQKYHAILADILMTEMTGVEFLRALRRHDLDVPVILMTAGPTRDSAIDAIEYGAQQYLLKPVEPDALVQAALSGDPLLSIAREVELGTALAPTVTLDEVNAVARATLTDSNRVVLIAAPAQPDVALPTQADLLGVPVVRPRWLWAWPTSCRT